MGSNIKVMDLLNRTLSTFGSTYFIGGDYNLEPDDMDQTQWPLYKKSAIITPSNTRITCMAGFLSLLNL